MKNVSKRIFSLLLAFVMLLSVVPMNHAHATENEPVIEPEVITRDEIIVATPDAAEETEAAELPDFSFASVMAPALMEGVTVDKEDVQIVNFEKELNEVLVLGAEGDPVPLTEEQKATLVALYQNYVDHRNANADVLGVQVPFFLSFNDNEDSLGVLGEVMSLANIPLAAVRAGQVDYATLEGMMVIFLYTDILGIDFYGDAIKAARDEALQAVKDSGAKTEAQKQLVLNDWLAENVIFDMPYIMGEDKMQAETPVQHQYYDEVYDVMYDMYLENIEKTFKDKIVGGLKDAMMKEFYIAAIKQGVYDSAYSFDEDATRQAAYDAAYKPDELIAAEEQKVYDEAYEAKKQEIWDAAYDEAFKNYATSDNDAYAAYEEALAEFKAGQAYTDAYNAAVAEYEESADRDTLFESAYTAAKELYLTAEEGTAEYAARTAAYEEAYNAYLTANSLVATEATPEQLAEAEAAGEAAVAEAAKAYAQEKAEAEVADAAAAYATAEADAAAVEYAEAAADAAVLTAKEDAAKAAADQAVIDQKSTIESAAEVAVLNAAEDIEAAAIAAATETATAAAEKAVVDGKAKAEADANAAVEGFMTQNGEAVQADPVAFAEKAMSPEEAAGLAQAWDATWADWEKNGIPGMVGQFKLTAYQAAIKDALIQGGQTEAAADAFMEQNADAIAKDPYAFCVATFGQEAADQFEAGINAELKKMGLDPSTTTNPEGRVALDLIVALQMDTPQQDEMLQKPDGSYMTPNEAIPVFSEQAATESTVGVLQFWEGAHFGALGEGKAVCLGYADAYSYLVQCMHPEYYTKNGDYKTASSWITDMNQLYYTNGQLDINKGYFTDFVRITFDTDVTMFGVVEENFNSDHFWNAARVDGQWYYVDPCYTDVFVEVMMRDRAETDGNVDHMYFMFSHDSAVNLYDGYYAADTGLISLYKDAADDTRYEDSWTARIASDTSYADGYAYYVYSSRDLITMMDEFNESQNNQNGGMTETDYNTNYEYKLVRHQLTTGDIGDGDNDYEALIEFNHPVETEGEEESEETVARVYNPTTKAMEDNAFLTALYAQHYADTQVYPSLAITCAKDGNLLYFNLSNYLLAYNLVSGEIFVVKEYKSVSARRDKTNGFGAMAFSVVGESGGDLTVQNHPIAGIIKKADGKLYVSIGTNFSYISGKETNDKTHETPEDPGAVGEYGYEYEESNYNPKYNSYGNDMYDNSQYEQYGYEQETNDNDEFMWTANFVETQNMSSVAVNPCSTHTYETVEVAATCEHNAYTLNMCATCGAVEAGTYAEVADTIHNHHYIYFAETYYTKDDQNQNRWNSGECYVCTECGFSCEEPTEPQQNQNVSEEEYQKMVEQYEKDLAIWNNAVETAGHEYSVTDAAWAQDNTTVTFSKLTCDHCKARKANLDCLLNDNTIDTTLKSALTVEASVAGYTGDCTEGAVATYAASGRLEQGGTFYVAKDVKLAAGNHAYEIAATWNLVADEEGNAVLDANGKAQYTVDATLTCAICGDAHEFEAVAATLDTENSVAPTCTEVGTDLYTVTIAPKNASGAEIGSATATLSVEVPALGHNYEDNICTVCGVTKLVITTQPKTTYTKMGDTMSTTVVVEGEGELKYQWYIKNVGSEKYVKSSITEPTYTCEMKAKSKDRRLICIVTDETGNKVQSKTVIMREAVSIVTEPKTTYGKQGATIKVKIEASGDDLTYQWYLKNAGGEKYTKSTIKDDTYVVDMSKKVDGRRIRCVVKDKYGKKVETKTVVLRMAATITEQPDDVTIAKGKTAEATVKAVGTDLTYQWYIKNKGSDKFVKSSITDATYTVKMAKKVDGREAYCVVKDKYGKTAKSDIITFTMKK